MSETEGGIVQRIVPEHREDLLGLPYPVLIKNAVIEKVDGATGEVLARAIPDLDGLVASVAMIRALTPVKLSGEEIRFLRKAIGATAREVADTINVDPATFSRWETGAQGIGEYVERLLRHHISETLAPRAPAVDFDPSRITTMRILPAWPEGSVPPIEVTRVVYKDGVTRAKSIEWDAEVRMAA